MDLRTSQLPVNSLYDIYALNCNSSFQYSSVGTGIGTVHRAFYLSHVACHLIYPYFVFQSKKNDFCCCFLFFPQAHKEYNQRCSTRTKPNYHLIQSQVHIVHSTSSFFLLDSYTQTSVNTVYWFSIQDSFYLTNL